MTHEREQQVWMGMGGMIIALTLLIPALIMVLDIQYDYTLRVVMLGAGVLGFLSGTLGTFAVLRKQSLLGDALSHAALPGVALAFLLAGRELTWLLVGAGIAGWLVTLFIQAVLNTTRIKQDTAMAISLSVTFGFGIALLGYIQSREDASRAGLNNFIFGQAAAISREDVELVSLVTLVIVAIILLFWKEFKLLTFDREFASTNGYPVRWIDILLSTLIVITIVLGLQLAGVILMVGLLIAPAVAARQWTNSLGQMLILSALFGVFSGVSGALISAAESGLPTGPLIIVMATIIVMVSIALSPGRGLLWQWWQQRRDQSSFAGEQLLQDMHDIAMHHDDMHHVPEGMLIGLRGKAARLGIIQLQEENLISGSSAEGWQLTPLGISQSKEANNNRALWQAYRIYQESLNLPLIAEDWRKPIGDFLSASIVDQLQALIEEEK